MSFNFKFKCPFFLIGLVLTIALLWSLTQSSYFSHHDDVQVMRIYQMDKCFQDGQIPCRWVPDLGGMYGYPLFNYYAPLPYYFGELIFALSRNLFLAAKVMFALPFIGAYIFMYLLGRKLWGVMGGSVSAIFYSFAPYHAVVFYVRGAMGELWALMVFPALLWSLWRLWQSGKVLNALVLSFFLSLLFLSHNLSTLIFLPAFLILSAILFYLRRDLKFFQLFLLSWGLGLLLSSFYLLPMVWERGLVRLDSTTVGYFSYTEHFKGFNKLILSRFWGYGDSVREGPEGQVDGMSYQIGWIHLIGFVLSILTINKLSAGKKDVKLLLTFFITIVIMAALMVHPRSLFIWRIIEPLKYLQFPWRFLLLITFCVSLISGSIFLWINQRRQFMVWLALISAVVIFNFSYFKPRDLINLTEKEYLSGSNWEEQTRRSIMDFLPIYASEPPGAPAAERFQILTGETEVLNFRQGTNWITFQAKTKSHSIIRLSQFYFPNWQIKVDGEPVKIDYENTWGLMTFILKEGDHQVEANLNNTPIRVIANWLSIAGVLSLIILILTRSALIKRWFSYYKKL